VNGGHRPKDSSIKASGCPIILDDRQRRDHPVLGLCSSYAWAFGPLKGMKIGEFQRSCRQFDRNAAGMAEQFDADDPIILPYTFGGRGNFQSVKLQRPDRDTVCSHSQRDATASVIPILYTP